MATDSARYPLQSYVRHPLLSAPHPITPIVTQELFEDAVSYEAKPGDIFICAYPKCGSTWVQNALGVMRREGRPLERDEYMGHEIPFLEFAGKKVVESGTSRPRIIKCHFPQEIIPWNDQAKYIVIARNPKDCITSFYHHAVGFERVYGYKDGKFEDFFEKAIVGDVDGGDYFKYTSDWWEKSKKSSNVLFVLYEDMKENMEREFMRIVEFLGNEWPQKVKENDGELLKKIIDECSFDKMQKNKQLLKTEDGFLYRPPDKPFIRKGVIGDWKTIFTEEQSKRVDKRMTETGTKHPGFDHIWDKYSEYLAC